jgi:hypothetical protein
MMTGITARNISRSLTVALSAAIFALLLTPAVTPPVQAQDSSRPIMAYYYGWWTDGTWFKTSDVPPELYDSWSDTVMRRQIDQARRIGITAFICTWDFNCERLLKLAEEMGNFSVAFSVDPGAEHKLRPRENLVRNMQHMSTLTSNPAYLRWHGKPVFVFWNGDMLPGDSSVNGFRSLRDQVDPHRKQFWLGGGVNFNYLDVFDAIHFYDLTWESSQGAAMASYSAKLSGYNSGRGANKPFVATVMPGYDDILIRNGHRRDRENGKYYRDSWDTAMRYNAQAIVITSWNEWYEGSQIEPSVKYSDLCLNITRDKIAQFRTRPGGFAHHRIEQTWAREDRPVAEGRVSRTWTWGFVRREAVFEPYNGGSRKVQYFDKARMEINDPNANQSSTWFVTSGLLAKEMITGRVQVSDHEYQQRSPANVKVAGDTSDPNGPTYATFGGLLNEPPLPVGTSITQRIHRNGRLPSDNGLTRYGVTASHYVPQTNHTVASVF